MANMSSPMTVISMWEDVFRALDKLSSLLHTKSNSVNTGATGFVHLCFPDVAHLMVNRHGGTICLFHHFHHDAEDGLNDGTNALWALRGMAVDTKYVVGSHVGTPHDWSKMLAWNSMADVSDAIDELMTTRSSVSRVDESAGQAPAPARAPTPSATARGWPKAELLDRPNQSTKCKPLTSNTTDTDDTEDVTVI